MLHQRVASNGTMSSSTSVSASPSPVPLSLRRMHPPPTNPLDLPQQQPLGSLVSSGESDDRSGSIAMTLPASVAVSLFVDFQDVFAMELSRKLSEEFVPRTRKQKKLKYLEAFELGLWGNFPRTERFYSTFLRNVNRIAEAGPESFVSAVLHWLPFENDLTDSVTWDFHTFLDRIAGYDPTNPRHVDIVNAYVRLVGVDILAVALKYFDGKNVSRNIVSQIIGHAFAAIRTSSSIGLVPLVWDDLNRQIIHEYALVLRWLSKYRMSEIVDMTRSFLKSQSRNNQSEEEVISLYSSLHMICMRPRTEESRTGASNLLDLLLDELDACKQRKSPRRLHLLRLLHDLIIQIDFSAANPADDPLLAHVTDIIVRVEELSKTSELTSTCYRIMVAHTMRLPFVEYSNNAPVFFQTYIVQQGKRKPEYLLETVLSWLRGSYYSPREIHMFGSEIANPLPPSLYRQLLDVLFTRFSSSVSGHLVAQADEDAILVSSRDPDFLHVYGSVYQYVTRPEVLGETTPTDLSRRLELIYSIYFQARSVAELMLANLNTYSEILVHFAVLDFEFFRRVIHVYLSGQQTSSECMLMAFRTLRKILDPEYCFFENAIRAPTVLADETVMVQELRNLRGHASSMLNTVIKICERDVGTLPFGLTPEPFVVSSYRTAGTAVSASGLLSDLDDVDGTSANANDEEDSAAIEIATKEMHAAQDFWNRSIGIAMSNEPSSELVILQQALQFYHREIGDFADFDGLYATSIEKLIMDVDKKKKYMKPELTLLIAVYQEAMRCLPVMTPSEVILSRDPTHFIGSLLLHPNHNLALACSHSLQRIVFERPDLRYPLIEGILQLILRGDFEPYHHRVLVENLCFLAEELLQGLKEQQRELGGLAVEDQGALKHMMILSDVGVYRILCFSDCYVRAKGFRFMKIIAEARQFLMDENALSPSIFDVPKHLSISQIVERFGAEIYRSAVFRIIEDCPISTRSVQIGSDFPLKSMEELANDVYSVSWPFVLGELGILLVRYGIPEVLAELQKVMLWIADSRISRVPMTRSDGKSRPQNANSKFAMQHLTETILILSIIDVRAPFAEDDVVLNNQIVVDEQLGDILSSLLSTISSELDWPSSLFMISASYINPRSIPSSLLALDTWFVNSMRKFKKLKNRIDMIELRYHIIFTHFCRFFSIGSSIPLSRACLGLVQREYNALTSFSDGISYSLAQTVEEVIDVGTLQQCEFLLAARISRAFNKLRKDEKLDLLESVWNMSSRQLLLQRFSSMWNSPTHFDGTSRTAELLPRKVDPAHRDAYLALDVAIATKSHRLVGVAIEEVVKLGPFLQPLLQDDIGSGVLVGSNVSPTSDSRSSPHRDRDEDDMVEEDQIASAALDNNRLLVFRASADLSMLEPYFIAHRSGLNILESISTWHPWLLQVLVCGFFQNLGDREACILLFRCICWMFMYPDDVRNSLNPSSLLRDRFRMLRRLRNREEMGNPPARELTSSMRKRFKYCRHAVLHMCLFILGDVDPANRLLAYHLLLVFSSLWETKRVGEEFTEVIRPYDIILSTDSSAQVSRYHTEIVNRAGECLQTYSRAILMDGFQLLGIVESARMRNWISRYLSSFCVNLEFTGSEDDSVLLQHMYDSSLNLYLALPFDSSLELWIKICQSPYGNLDTMCHYLMRRCTRSDTDAEFCGRIFADLFRIDRIALLDLFLREISPERHDEVLAVTMSQLSLNSTSVDSQVDRRRTAEAKGTALAQMEIRRKASIRMFPYILPAIDDQEELFQLLPRLFVYTMLTMGVEKGSDLSNPHALLLQLTHQLLSFVDRGNEHAEHLHTLDMYLRSPRFSVNWRLDSYQKVYDEFDTDVIREYSPSSEEEVLRYQRLYPVVLDEMDAALFVQRFVDAVVSIEPRMLSEFGNECLAWASLSGESTFRVKALTMYRSLLSPLTKVGIQMIIKLLHRSCQTIERGWKRRKLAASRSQSLKERFLWKLLSMSDAACFAPGLLEALECLNALYDIACHLRAMGTCSQYPEIFWTAVSILRSPLPSLYRPAVRLLQILASVGSVYEMLFVGSIREKGDIIQYATNWNPSFQGVRPLLLQGLMDESLEEDMYNFLAGLLTAPCYQMVDNSPSREMMSVLQFLPILYREMENNGPVLLTFSMKDIVHYVIEMLDSSANRHLNGELVSLLREFSGSRSMNIHRSRSQIDSEAFLYSPSSHARSNRSVEELFRSICLQIPRLYFPEHASVAALYLTNMYIAGPKHNQLAVIRIAACFLSTDPADISISAQVVPYFIELIKVVSQHVQIPKLSAAAGDLLANAVSASARSYMPQQDPRLLPSEPSSPKSTLVGFEVNSNVEIFRSFDVRISDSRELRHTLSALEKVLDTNSRYVAEPVRLIRRDLSGRLEPDPRSEALPKESSLPIGRGQSDLSSVGSSSASVSSRSPAPVNRESSSTNRFPALPSTPTSNSVPASSVSTSQFSAGPTSENMSYRFGAAQAASAKVDSVDPMTPSRSTPASTSRAVPPSDSYALSSLSGERRPPMKLAMAADSMLTSSSSRALEHGISSPLSSVSFDANDEICIDIEEENNGVLESSTPFRASSSNSSVLGPPSSSLQSLSSSARKSEAFSRDTGPSTDRPLSSSSTNAAPIASGSVSSRAFESQASLKLKDASTKSPPSMMNIVSSPDLFLYFDRFVRSNYESDALDFFIAVREFVSEPNSTKQSLLARIIIERFVSLDSMDTVNIEDLTRRQILREYAASSLHPPIGLFDKAQSEILSAMQSALLPAFLRSREYELMQKNCSW